MKQRATPPQTHQTTQRVRATLWFALCCTFLPGCPSQTPAEGVFPIKIIALTGEKVGIKGAQVSINKKHLGTTDAFGTFVGTYRGRIGSKITVRVQGSGNDNYMIVKNRLRLLKTTQGLTPKTIYLEAFLRGDRPDSSQTPQPLSLQKTLAKSPNLQPNTDNHKNDLSLQKKTTRTMARRTRRRRTKRARTKRKAKKIALLPIKHQHKQIIEKPDFPAPKTPEVIPPVPKKALFDNTPSVIRLAKPSCFRRKRRLRMVLIKTRPNSRLSLKGSCDGEQIGLSNKQGLLKVKMPVGTFQRVLAHTPNGMRLQKVIEIQKGRGTQTFNLGVGLKGKCTLRQIFQKTKNKIALEQEELNCLEALRPAHPQFLKGKLLLTRNYCKHKLLKKGAKVLDKLLSIRSYRYDPYKTLQMGIENSRCKRYSRAISLFRATERTLHKFSVPDKYKNTRALFFSMSVAYERKYYRTKVQSNLQLAVSKAQRLLDLLRPNDSFKPTASRHMKDLKKLHTQHSNID